MRLSRQQLADNEAKIRTAMTRLLNGDIPPGGKCDIKTLAGTAGVDRTAFYGSRPYAYLRAEFEQRLRPESTSSVATRRLRSLRSGFLAGMVERYSAASSQEVSHLDGYDVRRSGADTRQDQDRRG